MLLAFQLAAARDMYLTYTAYGTSQTTQRTSSAGVGLSVLLWYGALDCRLGVRACVTQQTYCSSQ